VTPPRALVALVAAGLAAGALAAPAPAANDPGRSKQWALDRIGADAAWAAGTGRGTTVAVIDTGVDARHEDLSPKIADDVSCIGAAGDPSKCSGSGADDDGHGTHVAGIAAAATGNGRGIAGVAPAARILAVRVLQHDPFTDGARGSVGDVRAGIRWALGNGADVINLSLGPEVSLGVIGAGLDDDIAAAWEAGVVVVVAAGNEILFPSGYGDVDAIVVTATDRQDRKASYASTVGSARWGMAAPGGDGGEENGILSTWWAEGEQDRYAYAAGTSMAAPHVAGAAAVLRSLGLSPQQSVERILSTAADLGASGRDSVFGHGRLDLAAATAGLGSPPSTGVTTTTVVDGGPPASGGASGAVGVRTPDDTPTRVTAGGAGAGDEQVHAPHDPDGAESPGREDEGDAPSPGGAVVTFAPVQDDGDGAAAGTPRPRGGDPGDDLVLWAGLAATLLGLALFGVRHVLVPRMTPRATRG
jgi:subtilisin family serine protease